MRTIAFLNQKGGTGKTVSAASFGRSLAADHGKRVLLIDADFQGNLSQYFRVGADETNSTWTLLTSGAGYWEEFISDTTEERIHIIPADMSLANADMPGSCAKPWAVRDLIEVLQEDDAYDYCIIDCHPYFGVITQAALLAADEVIVPLRLETFSTDGVREILQQLRNMRELNPRLRVAGILGTQYMDTKEEREAYRFLREESGLPTFERLIRMSPPVMRSVSRHESLFTISPGSGAARDYRKAVNEYLKGVGA